MTEVVGPKENRPKALRPSFTYLDHGDRCGCGPDGPMDGPTEEELADHCIEEGTELDASFDVTVVSPEFFDEFFSDDWDDSHAFAWSPDFDVDGGIEA